jgi:hypothetical protein
MRSAKLLNGLDLHDQPLLHQNVDLESSGEHHAIESYVDWLLPIDLESGSREAAGKHRFINGLEESRPKLPVYAKGSMDDFAA